MAIKLKYVYEKNGKYNVRHFRQFFFDIGSDIPAFKGHVFESDFEF